MELICEKKENSFQSFSCGNTKVTFDNNGYVIKAEGFSSIMWGTLDLDEKLIGKHIIELARILKKYMGGAKAAVIIKVALLEDNRDYRKCLMDNFVLFHPWYSHTIQ